MNAVPSPSRVVLAEDNLADIHLVREALQEHHVRCDLRVVSDGEEMLHFINQLDLDNGDPCPDLLLLDLGLPKYSGREILQHLLASKKCSHVPVVVMTSSDWRKDVELAEKHASVHYFRKPSTLAEFMHLGGLVKNMIEAPCRTEPLKEG